MTPEQLKQVGEALYGHEWQSRLARDLNISSRTVRRWAAGEYEVQGWAIGKLIELCQVRSIRIDRAIDMLSAE